MLGHFGDHDDYATPEAIRTLSEGFDAAQIAHNFHVYPGAGHAFANEDRPEVYDQEADQLSWQRTLEFLRKNLQP